MKDRNLKEELKQFMKEKDIFSSADVIAWGLDHHHIRANRDRQQIRAAGLIRDLTPSEKTILGLPLDAKQGWFKWVDGFKPVQVGKNAEFSFLTK